MADDLRVQERAVATPQPDHVFAPGYIRCPAGMHPDHGEAVVFTPGQLIPGWAAQALVEQRPEPTFDGIYVLVNTNGPDSVRAQERRSHGQAEKQDQQRRR